MDQIKEASGVGAPDQAATRSPRRTPWWGYGLVAFWAFGVLAGYTMVLQYHVRGAEQQQATREPAAAAPSGRRLLVFVHPKCPCSLASVRQLSRIISRDPTLPVEFHLFLPADASSDWAQGAVWELASRIPTACLELDVDGALAASRHVEFSGHCILLNEHGECLFSGGVTPGRGHEGDSAGGNELLAAILTGRQAAATFDVFGCRIVPRSTPASCRRSLR